MKRLYICSATMVDGSKVLTFCNLIVGEENEVTGRFVNLIKQKFPTYYIGDYSIHKIPMNEILEIIEGIDIDEPRANFIKKVLSEKGY